MEPLAIVTEAVNSFIAARDAGRLSEALHHGEAVVGAVPTFTLMWIELGRVQRRLGRLDDAIRSFRQAATLDDELIAAAILLGHATLEKLRYHERCSIDGYCGEAWSTPGFCDGFNFEVVKIDLNVISELFNIGLDLSNCGRLDESIRCFNLVLRLRPDIVHTYYALSCVLLTQGRFQEARPLLLDWVARSHKLMAYPDWRGESLEGKVLYVFVDHGLGDIVQFIRYLPAVARRCKKLFLGVPSNLWRIIGEIPNVEMVTNIDFHVDYMCSLFALPHVVGVDLDRLPGTTPYLHAEPALLAAWRERLPRDGLRIGIAWQGNPSSSLDAGRSMPLACFAPVARIPGVTLVSLQMNFGLDQLDHLPDGMSVVTLGPDFNAGPDNVVDTAAVMKNLDLIISSDTSVPHIAGALGCPVWVVLKAFPDWRWLQDREDCPWYPTMRLFRQTTPGNWDEVMARVARGVADLIAGRSGTPDRRQSL